MRTYKDFLVTHLTAEQHARTCNYWYVVRTDGTAHTAFRTLRGLLAWCKTHGLPEPVGIGGHAATVELKGAYQEEMYMDRESFDAIQGKHIIKLSNGSYTLGKVTSDTNGVCTVHYCNPNVCNRPHFNHQDCQNRIDHGDYTAPAEIESSALIGDLLLLLEQAVRRVELANRDGDNILTAWLPDAQHALNVARFAKR